MPNIWNEQSVSKVTEFIEGHFHHLRQIEQAVRENRPTRDSYARRKSIVPLDAGGNGTLQWQVPLGFDWILQRVTLTSTGNGQAQIYVDSTNPSDMVEVIGSTQLYSDAFDNEIFAPGGSSIFVVFTNAGANGQGTVNLQVKQVEHAAEVHRLNSYHYGSA